MPANSADLESEIHENFSSFVRDFWDGGIKWDEVRYDDPRLISEIILRAIQVLERWPQIDDTVRSELGGHIDDWMREAPKDKLERMRISERLEGVLKIERVRPSFRDDSERRRFERQNKAGEQLAWAYILHRGDGSGARALERAFEEAEGIIEPKEISELSFSLVELVVISAAVKARWLGDGTKISELKEARTFGLAVQKAREVLESS